MPQGAVREPEGKPAPSSQRAGDAGTSQTERLRQNWECRTEAEM